MDHLKKTKVIQNTCKPFFLSHQPESLSPVAQCLKLIDMLFEVRLIEYLSSPIDLALKHQLVDQYRVILCQLHEKLNFLKKSHQNSCASTRSQSYRHSQDLIATKNMNWQKNIYKIQARYLQVLINGSFKHYSKLLKLYNLKTINLIDISEWAKSCISQVDSSNQKCC